MNYSDVFAQFADQGWDARTRVALVMDFLNQRVNTLVTPELFAGYLKEAATNDRCGEITVTFTTSDLTLVTKSKVAAAVAALAGVRVHEIRVKPTGLLQAGERCRTRCNGPVHIRGRIQEYSLERPFVWATNGNWYHEKTGQFVAARRDGSLSLLSGELAIDMTTREWDTEDEDGES